MHLFVQLIYLFTYLSITTGGKVEVIRRRAQRTAETGHLCAVESETAHLRIAQIGGMKENEKRGGGSGV